jgi:RNA polymerase-binding transcription factor DksA
VWLLNSEQKMKALAIIEAYQKQAQPNTYQDWKCPQCSEINEGQFGACWRCGHHIE